jgi:hypothetical protein
MLHIHMIIKCQKAAGMAQVMAMTAEEGPTQAYHSSMHKPSCYGYQIFLIIFSSFPFSHYLQLGILRNIPI